MNEYFLHGKAFMVSGGYREISLVITAKSARDASDNATKKVLEETSGSHAVVFDVMTKM